MQFNLSSLILALAAAGALSGCTASVPTAPLDTTVAPSAPAASVPWHLQAQRSIGCYHGFELPTSYGCQKHPGYCRGVDFDVPRGATKLNLTLFYEGGLNTTDGSASEMGLWVHSPYGAPLGYPGPSDDQRRWLDNPKRLSLDNPDAGRWSVSSNMLGTSNSRLGNLTVDLFGVSAHPPSSLNVSMDAWLGRDNPCS